jgi:nucleotidyltransferase/DNA polymerase involved in DNA repair
MRRILHWDADAFFASIEQAADRRLRARPLAVGGLRRGVVLSASHEARRFGIHPGTPMPRARRLCPSLTVVPAHFDLYEQFSEQILLLCEQSTPLVEPSGSGAAWLDLTGTTALLGQPLPVACQIRHTVANWLRIPLSFALATNKTVARIAARLRKPHAPCEIPPGTEASFLAPLPLRWLPGLSPAHQDTLAVAGIDRIGDLAQAPLAATSLILGKNALPLQRRAQGLDEAPVAPPRDSTKPSWRQFIEFSEDVWQTELLAATARQLLDSLMPTLRAEGLLVRKLTLGLRYTDREENERSILLAEPSNLEADFYAHLPSLLRQAWQRRVRLRALWLRASHPHTPSPQFDLFSHTPQQNLREKEQRLAAALDQLRTHFGSRAVRRGFSLLTP